MDTESQFKVLTGRETTALGEPVIITTAQMDREEGLISEHFVILPKRTPTLERSRIRYKMDVGRVPTDLVTIADLVTVEVLRTREWLQNEVLGSLTAEEKSMRQLFIPYNLNGADKSLLVQYALASKYSDELKKIRQSTRCTELRNYLLHIETIPTIEIIEEPMLLDMSGKR